MRCGTGEEKLEAGKGRRLGLLLMAAAGLLLLFATRAGKVLVVDDPAKSDVIVVLAGETERRPARGLELLDAGFGKRVLIDVPANTQIYRWPQVELAEKYVQGIPQAAAVQICPIASLSTKQETREVEKCLAGQAVERILLVTSDYHTRRALNIFRHEIPGRTFSAAAAYDDRVFGTQWWRHREWAKTCLAEWVKVLWWNVVERWQ
jgi:uncharacterized SAM-binding protein YcdF (DUF218 family)